jgi:hypothetical protein
MIAPTRPPENRRSVAELRLHRHVVDHHEEQHEVEAHKKDEPRRTRARLRRSICCELPDTTRLGPEIEQAGQERRGVQDEPDHDPVVAESVEIGLALCRGTLEV